MSESNRKTKRLALTLFFLSLLMVGFGYALVPLYNVFCEVTGFGGRVVGQEKIVEDRSLANLSASPVNLRLDATVGSVGRFEFYPPQKDIEILTGEPVTFSYTVTNKGNQRVVGQAIPTILPAEAAPYVKKLECFCFKQQVLEAQQTLDLPVQVIVEKDLPFDIQEITLSYVYYDASEQNPDLLMDHSQH